MARTNWLAYSDVAGSIFPSGLGGSYFASSRHSNVIHDHLGNIYVYRGLDGTGSILKFTIEGEQLWRLKITSNINTTISSTAVLMRINPLRTDGVRYFPEFGPTSRSYEPPRFSNKSSYTMSGRSVRTCSASLAGESRLTLVYENISYTNARRIVEYYDLCYGSAIPFTLPDAALRGLSTSLSAFCSASEYGFSWKWEKPPKVDSVSSNVCTVTVNLISFLSGLRTEEIFIASFFDNTDYSWERSGYALNSYLVAFNGQGQIIYANRYYTNGKPLNKLTYDQESNRIYCVSPHPFGFLYGCDVVSINPISGQFTGQCALNDNFNNKYPDLVNNIYALSSDSILITGNPYLIKINKGFEKPIEAVYYSGDSSIAGFNTSYEAVGTKVPLKSNANMLFSPSASSNIYHEVNDNLDIVNTKRLVLDQFDANQQYTNVRLDIDYNGYVYFIVSIGNNHLMIKANWETTQLLSTTEAAGLPMPAAAYLSKEFDRFYIVPARSNSASPYRYSYIAHLDCQLPSTPSTLYQPNVAGVSLTARSYVNPNTTFTNRSDLTPQKNSHTVNYMSFSPMSLQGPMPATIIFESQSYTVLRYSF